ncbi:MAG TPA: acyl carrier protein [Rhizomicrobium sp.]|jgi:acyl carrier protein|nr:acyl carrier protein [Rhizomicrobium sp.]
MTRDDILADIRAYMVELFDTAPDAVTLDASLIDDLDLDSIDAVDLIVKLQQLVGQKIQPEVFKSVRTVRDIVERVYRLAHARTV